MKETTKILRLARCVRVFCVSVNGTGVGPLENFSSLYLYRGSTLGLHLTNHILELLVNKPEDPPDVLDKHKCLEALANLRRAKWFQVG